MPPANTQHARLRRLFIEGFTAIDLAEPLVSFDTETDALKARAFREERLGHA